MHEPIDAFRVPDRVRAGNLSRRHGEHAVGSGVPESATSTRLSSLSPSLTQDLLRFDQDGRAADLLEVLAAALRHGRSITAHLWHDDKELPLTVFPRQQLAYCPLAVLTLLKKSGASLSVLQVEPAMLRPPGDAAEELVGKPHLYRPLSPLLWSVALHDANNNLLPELSGAAVYRLSPTFDLAVLSDEGPIRMALTQLREDVASLRVIASWPGMSRELAKRLLNALYLQSGLIISRSHPAALSDSWFSSLLS